MTFVDKQIPSKVEIFTLLGDFVYAIPFSFLLSFFMRVFLRIHASKNVKASATGCAKQSPSNPNFIGNKNTSGKKKNPCRAAARNALGNARPTACK